MNTCESLWEAIEALPIRSPRFYEANDIALQAGHTTTDIDRESRRVVLDERSEVQYSTVVLPLGV